jgi:hypothetical protein
MKAIRKVYVALPVLNESENLPGLIESFKKQDMKDFELVVCVNNYNRWWDEPGKNTQCTDNQKSLKYLRSIDSLMVQVIDRSSPGHGWPDKKGGVGWARKIAMDEIANKADDHDLIVSIDADTFYPENYLSAILDYFFNNPESFGLSLPYYHKLTDKATNRLILRYEIYMRYYLLNMLRIKNPYAYTALGSAMAFPVWAYKKVGGLTPVKSGEDFYFLQKLVKNGNIGLWAETIAYPSSRFSDRVLFGTGPALIKGDRGEWDSYPIYDFRTFDLIAQTFEIFPQLFEQDIATAMDNFLKLQNKSDDLWGALRQNYKDTGNFVKACIRKVDGLKLLQFLRSEQQNKNETNEFQLANFFKNCWPRLQPFDQKKILLNFSFDQSKVEQLNKLRDILFEEEMRLRKQLNYNKE